LSSIRSQAALGKQAAARLASLPRRTKDHALESVARALRDGAARIRAANQQDLERAAASGLSDAMLDRLRMNDKVIESAAAAVEQIVALPDPVGSRSEMKVLPNGLLVGRQRLPLGLIAIVYESRPNVTVDAAALCLKSGNAVLLRGGKEAQATNAVLGEVIRQAIAAAGAPSDAVQIVPPGDREEIRELLGLSGLIDLAIPRGGEALIRFVTDVARVPVVQHYKGVCHLFLDRGCDADMALALTLNGKLQRPGVCNALECLLVHALDAERLLPDIGAALLAEGVEIRGCPRTLELVPGAVAAAESDFGAEFLAKILAVRVVGDLDAALDHVRRYGSGHSEAICTDSQSHAERWLNEVDASCVLVNASTRFNDGGELGLGAELGISTSKLHAYGPMGLESLTAEKWIVLGQGQTRR
jgi:glutamate-5-semialdehyde dehydrogenase